MSDEFFKKQLELLGIDQDIAAPGERPRDRLLKSRLDLFKRILNTPDGREFIGFMFEMTSVFETPFLPGKPDISDFISGAHSVGTTLLKYVFGASPEKFYEIMVEADMRKKNTMPPEEPNAIFQ